MPKTVHHFVDQVLMEHGEYVPLEFLLRAGCIPAAAYEAWRDGDLDYLDTSLAGSPNFVEQRLLEAQRYMEQRGWQAHTVRHLAKQTVPPRALSFSQNAVLDQFFHRHYRKPPDEVQLDLFTDSPVANLVNGVFWALARCDSQEARRLCTRLKETVPTHRQMGVFIQLTDALEQLAAPVVDIAVELVQLQTSLLPLVQSTLGKEGRKLSVACWQRLSNALDGRPFDKASPEVHLSYTSAQTGDWTVVRRSVEREHGWRGEPVLLVRHATACEQLQSRHDALQSWFVVCWHFSDYAYCINTAVNETLREKWREFQELDPELAVEAFPAWLVSVTPGFFQTLPAVNEETEAPRSSYEIMLALQRIPGQNSQDQKIRLRAQLRNQDPILLQHYLAGLRHA